MVTGEFARDCLRLDLVHRFANEAVRLPDGLHWNVTGLFGETIAGLRRAGEISGVGVDAWGCDYALLDGVGRLLGVPFHHRDPRTADVPERAFACVSAEELYSRMGIQHLRFNTVFQLLADAEAGVQLESVDRVALIPDLLNYWLTGVLVNEATVASTTGMVDALTHSWALDLVERHGLPAAPFGHDLVEPGTPIAEVAPGHGVAAGVLVRTVAAHDTASAFVAAPLASTNAAVISCGTWSLVGVEIDEPRLDADAARANLSNEWGAEGKTRLLRPAEFTRSILLSLSCKYRLVLEELSRVVGHTANVVHIVGGGGRNEVLCQLAADVIGVPVLAGPGEATAIGNILVQARAAGSFKSHAEMRACVTRSFAPVLYEPSRESSAYDRFMSLTGTGSMAPASPNAAE